jgi:DNA-binding response OmpR family regulator
MKIALVEDNPVISGIIKEHLIEKRHRVLHISTIHSFEVLLNVFEPDLIITDILIYGISSRELIDYYKQFNCPIFVMSSIDKDELNYFSEMIDAKAKFHKPFDPIELVQELEDVINKKIKISKI